MAKSLAETILPARRHGIVIDVACILLNLFLFPFYNDRLGRLFDRSFADEDRAFRTLSFLMLVLVGFRLTGLYFKRFGLQARLDRNDDAQFPQYFLIFNVPIILLTSAFALIFFQMFLVDFGVIKKVDLDSPVVFGTGLILIISIICLESWLLWRLRKPLTEQEKHLKSKDHPLFYARTEFFADFGLFVYLMIWQVFYNQIVALVLYPESPANYTTGGLIQFFLISLFVFLIPCFLMFYVSPRTVFMIEDRKDKRTMITLPLAFLSSIVPQLVLRIL